MARVEAQVFEVWTTDYSISDVTLATPEDKLNCIYTYSWYCLN